LLEGQNSLNRESSPTIFGFGAVVRRGTAVSIAKVLFLHLSTRDLRDLFLVGLFAVGGFSGSVCDQCRLTPDGRESLE